MGSPRIITLLLLLCFYSIHANADEEMMRMGETQQGMQALYLIHRGDITGALQSYLEYSKSYGHDHELLQQMALQILEQGAQSKDPEIQMLSIFGAGISGNSALLPILEKGLMSSNPSIQVAALNFLSRFQDDEADELIFTALSSPFLIIRLEAAYYLAQKNHPQIFSQIESLMVKIPSFIKPLFPQIIVHLSSSNATKMLRQFFNDPDSLVRIQTILHVAKAEREDLLNPIRTLASHPDVAELEACALALGILKDESSIPLLQRLADSAIESISLAASYSLCELGEFGKTRNIIELAKHKYPFAIFLLGETLFYDEEIRSLLIKLMEDCDLNVRVNATVSLLKRKDPACIKGLQEILIRDGRDLAFQEYSSPGFALKAWRAVPCSKLKGKESASIYAASVHRREQILQACYQLPDSFFFEVAKLIFDKRQYDLVPVLVDLLRDKQTTQAIDLLKQEQQKIGSPLIRNYCNVALYRLQESGPYEQNLKRWLKEQTNTDLIQFREVLPKSQNPSEAFLLNPEEKSRLLVETMEALASSQSEASLEAIIENIAHGNSKNRYALAGLLLKTAE